MELPLGVEMDCTDGKCGRSTYLIINPVALEITHIVMRMAPYPHAQVLVPLDWIEDSSANGILLRCTLGNASTLPEFVESEYVELPSPLNKADAHCCCRECATPNQHSAYLTQLDMATWTRVRAHPYVTPKTRFAEEPLQHLAEGEIAVTRGAEVHATDGLIGHLDEFVVDSTTCKITHLVLREARSLVRHESAVPVSAIDRIYERAVYLSLGRKDVKALPPIPIDRHWA